MTAARIEPGQRTRRRPGFAAVLLAAVCGTVHAATSVYWSLGGTWLLETAGQRLIHQFAESMWILALVGIAKLLAALVPLGFCWSTSRLAVVIRGICWIGGVALVVWGGVNTVVAHLVLAGAVAAGPEFDRLGMIGHAWLWDPLFLVWGAALIVGLVLARRDRPDLLATG